MAFDYFTIQALAQELQAFLQGAVIERAYAQPTELAFSVDEGDWLYGASGREGLLCLRREAWPRPWRASDGPEKYLVRARVVAVEAEHRERLLRLRLERRDRGGRSSFGVLVCELIPNKVRFVLHRQADGAILGYWGTAKDRSPLGEPYQPPEPSGRLLPGTDVPSAWRDRLASADAALEKAARRWLAGADASVVRELIFRSQQGEGGLATALWSAATEAYTGAVAGQSYVWQEAGRFHFSALEPRRLQGAYEQFDAVSRGIWAACQKERVQRQAQQTQQQIRKRLGQALKNARRRLAAIQVELDEAARAEEYKRKGHTLWANIGQLSGRPTQVELADPFDSEEYSILRIDLDANRSLAKNAASYLKAAKKYERRQQVLPQLLAQLRHQCTQYEHWIGAVDAGTWEANAALQNWLESKMISADKTAKTASKHPQAHPRRYRTSTGWSVWAGRNNKENDVLTHKISAQNDLWFHAQGYPGSHVVLRSEGRKEAPSKQTIEEAAALAAYWSKGKTAKKVSVAYALVKHVTKPRGGAPGQALLRREKTIVVEPALLKKEEYGISSAP